MDRRFLAILAAIAAVFIGYLIFSQNSGGSKNSNTAQPTNHIIGQGQKNVTLVEYGDYQCPSCFAYEPVVEQVRAKYSKEIHFQFRNLPLVSLHNNAFAAARAAEAADQQGKFWEMHDTLYQLSNWQSWTKATNARSFFELYAKQIGLDITRFKQDYSSDKVNGLINADLKEFDKTGRPKGTPTFFLDGSVLNNINLSDPNTGQPSLVEFSKVIDAEIAKRK